MPTNLKFVLIFALLAGAFFGGYELILKFALKPQPAPVPDFICSDGVGVFTRGLDAGGICYDEAIVFAKAQADCPINLQDQLRKTWAGLSITLSEDNFPCESSPTGKCHGIQDGPFIVIGSHNALADEMGHVFWEICHKNPGEQLHLSLPDGGQGEWIYYDPDYQAWCGSLYPQLQ